MIAGDKVKHVTKPSEPFGEVGAVGHVVRVTPAARQIPAQAYIAWDDFYTWEKLTDLVKV